MKKALGKNFVFKMIDIASSYLDNNTDFALNAFIKESNKRSIKSLKSWILWFGSLNKKNKASILLEKN